MIKTRSIAAIVASLSFAAPAAAQALPAAKHVPAPHVCADGSAPVRGGVANDDHSHQTGKGHDRHGNGFGYGHGCGDTDGGDNGGGDDGGIQIL